MNENNGSDLNLGNSDDFLKGVNGNGEAPDTLVAPEKIGDYDSGKYFEAMSSVSGGQIKDFHSFNETIGYKAKYSELEKKHQELEAMSRVSPYASDLSKGIDDMLKKGATVDDVKFFVELQKIDPVSISNEDALKLAKKLSLSGASDADVQDWYEKTYGIAEEGEELTGSQRVKIMEDAKVARESLGKIKVDAGQPPIVLQQKQAQAQFQQRMDFWGNVMNKTVGLKEKHTLEISIGKDKDGKESSIKYDFLIPEDSRKEIALEAARYAARNGFGNNKEHYQNTQEIAEKMLWAKHGKEICENAVRHAKANITEGIMQSQHNVRPFAQLGKGEPIVSPIEEKDAAKAVQDFAKNRSKR